MTTLDKETYIKLAEVYCKQEAYEDEARKGILEIAEKHNVYSGFISLPTNSDLVMRAVYEILGDNFSYFFYECDESFEKFNKDVTLADGSHPNVQNFGDLWELENE